jgi:SAM-dependent methyltransferase
MTPGAMIFSDLTQMGIADDTIDILTCMHVMEHVPDDHAAYKEMRRMIKPEGFALVMVPLRGETTLEEPTLSAADRVRLYGQDDHVRMYGMDIVGRMEKAGLEVEVIDIFERFSPEVLRRNALYGDDRYLFRLSKAK